MIRETIEIIRDAVAITVFSLTLLFLSAMYIGVIQ